MTLQRPADDAWFAALERLWSRTHSSAEAAALLVRAAAADLTELCDTLGLDEAARSCEKTRLADRLHRLVNEVLDDAR